MSKTTKEVNKALRELVKYGQIRPSGRNFKRHPKAEKALTRLYFERCT